MEINFAQLSSEELTSMIAAANAELARRSQEAAPAATPAEKRRVSVSYGSYNARRYGRPWISRVTAWPVGGRPDVEWGGYVGTDDGGEVEILAKPGDIIRHGQKDNRGNSGSNEWAVVEPDYSLRGIDQAEARKLFAE